jgi:hypothetical protein
MNAQERMENMCELKYRLILCNFLTRYSAYQVIDYYDHFAEVSPTQPSFFPEFQGGSYNPWSGPEGGCPADIGADFANLYVILMRST